jgi:hypothetical protein
MFDSHAKRMAVERVVELKNSMISGAWANSNNDEGDNTRSNLLEKIDNFADSAIAHIYGYLTPEEEEYETDMESPFIKAMKVPQMVIDSKEVEEIK